MATGYFKGLDPVIPIALGAPDHPSTPITCLVDTGFDGFLLLPEAAAPDFELTETVPGIIEYADGSIAKRSWCIGVTEVDGEQRRGFVALEPGARQPLLGMMFLKAFGFKLTVDPSSNLVELVSTAPTTQRM